MATTKKLKHSEIEAKDRLSDLPESVILHMLSFLNAKHAVQTCVLSTRWKNLWKLLPVLIFNFTDFQFYKKFMNFIFKVLSLRNSSVTLQALEYKRDGGQIDPRLLKNIVNYAISHNVQRLGLCSYTKISQIPLRMFSCQSLTHLKLCTYPRKGPETMFPNSFNLPALISLQLQHFVFCLGDNNCAEPFSTFNKLNSLLISNCYLSGEGTLCISNVTLVDLTLYNEFYRFYTIELCTPSLCTFSFDGTPSQKLLGSNVSSLEHVEIYAEVIPHQEEPPLILFNWLLEFPNIKSLTVSTTTLQVLYLIPDLLEKNPPSLGNLKSLKVKMEPLSYEFRMTLSHVMLQTVNSKKEAAQIRREFERGLEPSSPIPEGILDFLRQNSPSAKVDYIVCLRQSLRKKHL